MWVLQGDPRERQEPQLWVQKWGMPSLWCYYHPRFFWHPFHNVWLSISACCPTPFFTSARWALQANDLQGLCISVQGFGLGFGGEVLHGGGLMQSEIPSGLDQECALGKSWYQWDPMKLHLPRGSRCGSNRVATLQRGSHLWPWQYPLFGVAAHTFGRGNIHLLLPLYPLFVVAGQVFWSMWCVAGAALGLHWSHINWGSC